MIFDQYSRYRACAHFLAQAGYLPGKSVLDVGSGPESLFGSFLDEQDLTFVDPLIAPLEGGEHIAGDVFNSRLDARRFAFVTGIDVLEHVPSNSREVFLERVSSLASDGLVLAFPSSECKVAAEVDCHINAHYRSIFGRDYGWLKEHFEHALPSVRATCRTLEMLGWQCQVIGHGHAPWLKELLSFVVCCWDIPFLKPIVLNVSEQFNHELFQSDFKPPHYRSFIVATRGPMGKLQAPHGAISDAVASERFRLLMDDAYRQYFSASMRRISGPDSLVANVACMERDIALIERDGLLASQDNMRRERDATAAWLDAVRRSNSWRMTLPLRCGARWLRHGLGDADRQRLGEALRRRYHRLPLPFFAKQWIGRARRAARLTVPSELHAVPFSAPLRGPGPQTDGMPDYIVWGVIDWHFRHQRPQQLALALAASGRRVFYISPNFTDDARGGFAAECLDELGRIFQIKLFLAGAPVIYSTDPGREILKRLRASIAELLDWADCQEIVSLIQHPFWHGVAAVLPNSRMVYDCMDHHEGFGNNTKSLLRLEEELLCQADLTITTSSWLEEAVASRVMRRALIRNACDYSHFDRVPTRVWRDAQRRRVIGYYGAIAEWFDVELVEAVARQHPECCVLLIGADTVNARARLSGLRNVVMEGEVPYARLPEYLHGFDLCLLPFKVMPLTLATNPVKIYEYLSAGKPVVAVDLPEMAQFEGLVRTATGQRAFLAAVCEALDAPESDVLRQRRKAFAQGQTWRDRAAVLVRHAEAPDHEPRVSVVVVTYNNLAFTRVCLASLDRYSQYPQLEIIVVDNASADGSPAWLMEWAAGKENRKLILNDDNKGFAAANNQGLAAASGDYLVLLNNDTHVTPGWLRTLIRHLRRDRTIGLIGPVTNNIGNQAKIAIEYAGMDEMLRQSAAYTRRRIGDVFPIRTAAFFCVMLPRSTWERVGPLDEAFGRGFFEDDDYCRRAERLGLRVVCADDVFIHHHLSASFDQLKQKDRQKLFDDNKKIYESKWGTWISHSHVREAVE